MPTPQRLGKYLIRRRLGAGAMGVVYEGFDPLIERSVAIKVIRHDDFDATQSIELRTRLKREAQAAGRLAHPGIVAVYEYGEAEAGAEAFIAMEMVHGRELKSALDAGERYSVADAARLMRSVLGALQHAHERGVVHRDIKPANVFLLADGSVKVADFGVARLEASDLTQTGAVIGTPSYMSPEQLLGQAVDGRSDLFSCGVLLYQLLTGEKPFTGSIATVMQKVLNENPAPPSAHKAELAPHWDAVVRRALAKLPADRFQSADEFAAAIARAQAIPPAAPAAGAIDMEQTIILPRRPALVPPAAPLPPPPAPGPEPVPRTVPMPRSPVASTRPATPAMAPTPMPAPMPTILPPPPPALPPPAPPKAPPPFFAPIPSSPPPPTAAAPPAPRKSAIAAAAALLVAVAGGTTWWLGSRGGDSAPAHAPAASAAVVATAPTPAPVPVPTPEPAPVASPLPSRPPSPPPSPTPTPAPPPAAAPSPVPVARPAPPPPGPSPVVVKPSPSPAPAVATVPPPASAPPDPWVQHRARLESAGASTGLGSALALLLDVQAPKDRQTLADFERLIATLPEHSALAVGARDGILRLRWEWHIGDAETASQTALRRCAEATGKTCWLMMIDGAFRKAGLSEAARQLGAVDVATVRGGLLRNFATELPAWRERVAQTVSAASAATPKPTPYAATPAPPPAAPAPAAATTAPWAADWALAQTRLRGSPPPRSLAAALGLLLQPQGEEETGVLARFDSSLRGLRWSSALAIGERGGTLVFGYAHSEAKAAWAADRALGACSGVGGQGCAVVWANGDVRAAELATLAARLEGQSQATVRRHFIELLRSRLARGL